MHKGAKIALAIGGVAVAGIGGYILLHKKAKTKTAAAPSGIFTKDGHTVADKIFTAASPALPSLIAGLAKGLAPSKSTSTSNASDEADDMLDMDEDLGDDPSDYSDDEA